LVHEGELLVAFGGEAVVFAGGAGGGFDEAGGDEALDAEAGEEGIEGAFGDAEGAAGDEGADEIVAVGFAGGEGAEDPEFEEAFAGLDGPVFKRILGFGFTHTVYLAIQGNKFQEQKEEKMAENLSLKYLLF
jgi:hypothetical protein